VHIVLTITLVAFVVVAVFVLGNLGSEAVAGIDITYEAQLAEFAWFSFFLTFIFIEVVWFIILILCGVCLSGLELFEPAEEGDNTKNGMICAVFLAMLGVIMVAIAQTILIVRVFFWTQFPWFTWDAPTAVGYTTLLDLVPAIVVVACCLLSPLQKGTVFRRKL